MLAYILLSLEQVAFGADIDGFVQKGSDRLFSAVFAHDFNLHYLRRMLGVDCLINSYALDVASTGAAMRFDLDLKAGVQRVRGECSSNSLQRSSSSEII